MLYCSTRGSVHAWDFQQVLFSGYAPDGGMFMPETLPVLSPETLRAWVHLSYPQLVLEVCALFIPEQLIPRQELSGVLLNAFSSFSVPEVIRLVPLAKELHILELFHGETLAFKDLGMTCMAHLLHYFLKRGKRRATVLVGTSGDTGGSAISSVRGLCNVDIVVVFPRGRISSVQERQMTCSLEDNVHVFAADGSSDDIDIPLRHLFSDSQLVERHSLISFNSVNWARIMVQLAHFLYAYLQLSGIREDTEDEVPSLEVVVPTGGGGNIAAGCILRHMGVPLQLVAMVNANDVVHRVVQSGDFSTASSVTPTLAPAIDIQDPYNLERVFWLLSGRDSTLVRKLMQEFQLSHALQLPTNLHKQLSQLLISGSVSDQEILHTIQTCWEENHYLLCPHTAVGVRHHYSCAPQPQQRRCCLATASPAKFPEVLQKAGLHMELPLRLQEQGTARTRFQHLERDEDWLSVLRECIESIGSVRDRGGHFYSPE